MRVLVTGANGQLARQLVATASSDLRLNAVTRAECDITEWPSVEKAFRSFRPDIVINTAAYTAVDRAEGDSENAFAVNAVGAGNVARASELVDARVIHISTDYVFDGMRSSPYTPDVQPRPLNVYGATKLAGEEAVRRESPNALIIRSSWVYSTMGKNFLLSILDMLRTGTTPRVVTDQRGSPTLAADLADVLWLCIKREGLKGVYHFANAGAASWYEFACEIRALALGKGAGTHVPDIIPVTSAEYKQAATRPRYSVLDSSALGRAVGHGARPWQGALRDAFDEIVERARIS